MWRLIIQYFDGRKNDELIFGDKDIAEQYKNKYIYQNGVCSVSIEEIEKEKLYLAGWKDNDGNYYSMLLVAMNVQDAEKTLNNKLIGLKHSKIDIQEINTVDGYKITLNK